MPYEKKMGQRNGRCVMPLERELATFHAKLPELLATVAGKYVLIHGDEVAGTGTPKHKHWKKAIGVSDWNRSWSSNLSLSNSRFLCHGALSNADAQRQAFKKVQATHP